MNDRYLNYLKISMRSQVLLAANILYCMFLMIEYDRIYIYIYLLHKIFQNYSTDKTLSKMKMHRNTIYCIYIISVFHIYYMHVHKNVTKSNINILIIKIGLVWTLLLSWSGQVCNFVFKHSFLERDLK